MKTSILKKEQYIRFKTVNEYFNPLMKFNWHSTLKVKIHLFFLFVLLPLVAQSQTTWISPKFKYSIELPKDFTQVKSTGVNVDFSAKNESNSIVIVVTTIPNEYLNFTIWEMLGDLTTFGSDWENGAKEFMNDPKFIKYGTTILSGLDAFWYDYTTDSGSIYSKTYQTKKGNKMYTITLTNLNSNKNSYTAIWLRFKNKFKIN